MNTKIFSIITLLGVLFFFACNSSNEIKGNWLLLERIISNDTFVEHPKQRMVVDFTGNGEMLFYHNHEKSGIGYYYYKVVKDSLIVYNVDVHPETGINDTIRSTKALFTIRDDTLFIDDKKYKKKYVYKRINSH